MSDKKTELPWADLKHEQGGIPWPALFELAAAVVSDDSLASTLIKVYEQAYESGFERPHYEDLYVPAVFALAASRLGEERRREIGALLIEKLVQAGRNDDDLSLEVLTAASGSMGPVILPSVLDAIRNEPDRHGAWFFLWGLTVLAAYSEDSGLRDSVVKACTELLRQADCGDIDPMDAIEAAWTLARMKCSDSIGLLERLKTKTANALGSGDYAEAMDLLRGESDEHPSANSWDVPVSEWLTNQWTTARDWYVAQGHERGEDGTVAASQLARELPGRFLESAEASELGADLLVDAEQITARILDLARDYVCSGPEQLDEHVLREVLLALMPHKLAAEDSLFEKVAPVTGAFLKWMETEGILADTASLVETVLGWGDTIFANSADPKRWGRAKSLAMRAKAQGVDITDEGALQAYVDDYYRRQFGEDVFDDLPGEADFTGFAPRIPIVEHSPKIGRNQPCPCGSGKKYKKCCGGVNKADIHS